MSNLFAFIFMALFFNTLDAQAIDYTRLNEVYVDKSNEHRAMIQDALDWVVNSPEEKVSKALVRIDKELKESHYNNILGLFSMRKILSLYQVPLTGGYIIFASNGVGNVICRLETDSEFKKSGSITCSETSNLEKVYLEGQRSD